MLQPKFLDLMIEKFLKGEDYTNPRSEKKPPFEDKQFFLLALTALKKPSNLEQIIIYLHFLFPWFIQHQDSFRKTLAQDKEKLDEVEDVQFLKDKRYVIESKSSSKVLKDLRNFASEKNNFDALKLSIFHEDYINVLFPGLEIAETEPKVSDPSTENSEPIGSGETFSDNENQNSLIEGSSEEDYYGEDYDL